MFDQINSIEFDVIDECNLKCSYCYLQSGTGTKNSVQNRMTNKVFDDFFDQYITSITKKNSFLNVSFWGGEPLLNFKIIKHIVKRVNVYKKKKFGQVDFLIVTNGTLISKKIAEFCKEHNVKFQITIDGDKKCHDQQRMDKNGKGTYDIILQNIKLLQKIEADYYVRTTLTDKSPPPSGIIETLKENSIKSDLFSIVSPTTTYNYKNLSYADSERHAKEIFDSYLHDFAKNNDFFYSNIDTNVKQFFSASPRTSCGVSKHKIAIKSDGTIYPCHRFVKSPKYCIGNVWDGIDGTYNDLYHLVVEKNENCKSCEYRYFCGGTCFYELSKTDDKNYIQKDVCVFKKSLLNMTFKFITRLYLYDKAGYKKLISKHSGGAMGKTKIQEINNPDINRFNQNNIPLKSEDAECVDLGEDGVIYLKNKFEKKYIANTTTMAIWDLIDGKRTGKEIANQIAQACQVNNQEIEEDIYKQLSALKDLGLLEIRGKS